MDRRQLLDRAAQSGEERVLLAHILDKCEQSRQRNIPAATDFLSPAEQRSAQDLLHAAAIYEGYAFRGGDERAERKMLFFLPDWQEEADESESMTALRCTYRKEDTLTHRDFLGSLMAQGITREKLGDILVSEGSCDLIVSRDIAPYLLQNLTGAGRVRFDVHEIALPALRVPAPDVKEIRDTVSALRLDAVSASGFSLTAAPTARYDFGFPRSRAISPLVTEVAKGTRESASHTLFWNSVPSGSSGTSKAVRFPAKYSRSSVAQRFESSAGRRVPASCTSPNATARTPRSLAQMVIGPWGVG